MPGVAQEEAERRFECSILVLPCLNNVVLPAGPDFGVFKQDVESIFERLAKSNGRHGKGATSAVIDHGNPRAWHGAKATSAVACQTDDQVIFIFIYCH